MLGSNLLDVAIGLIFVYFIFSLLVTVVNELIATYTRMRAGDLETALSRMIFTGDLYKKFYDHPLIRSLVKGDGKKPSYIEPRTFAKVVTDVILTNGNVRGLGQGKALMPLSHAIRSYASNNITPEKERKFLLFKAKKIAAPAATDIELLLDFADDASNNVDDFKKKLEEWFNETMDRVSGWYQRKIKIITACVGLVITIIFNVDSIKIYSILSTNNKVRGEVIVAAAGYLDKQHQFDVGGGSVTADKYEELLCEQIDPTVNILGIGWPYDSFWPNMATINGYTPVGWFLTIIAISLGAPFWFDLLSRAMKLRGTGTQVPTKSTEERSQPVG